jgi:hypothetical protein
VTDIITADAAPSNSAEASKKKSWRDNIIPHPAAAMFPRMSETELRELADDIAKNGLRERVRPFVLRDSPTTWFVADGINRLDAIELLIREERAPEGLRQDDLDGVRRTIFGDPILDDKDPYEYAISANIRRRHLTAEQKRELIAKLLQAAPEKSDRQVAKIVNVDHKTVGSVRKEKEATGEIPQLKKTVGADGKARPKTKGERQVEQAKKRRERRERAGAKKEEPKEWPAPLGKMMAVNLETASHDDIRAAIGLPPTKTEGQPEIGPAELYRLMEALTEAIGRVPGGVKKKVLEERLVEKLDFVLSKAEMKGLGEALLKKAAEEDTASRT